MQPTTQKPPRRGARADLRRLLREDHERLERVFADLLAAFRADAREDAARLWGQFDDGLRAHLELEESAFFPAFAEVQQAEVAALRGEHERIRARLLELGVGVDLHLTNDAQVAAFQDELRVHAAREDALLYQWAARALEPETDSRIHAWLKSFSKA